jgi:thymidylate kinase
MYGKLIVFEGADGVGKTTLVGKAIGLLQARNAPFVSLAFPGKKQGTLGHLVDKVHHARQEFGVKEITPLALQALHIAAHLDAIENEIKPALNNGIAVVLDRTWWSTWVYGTAANVNRSALAKLIEAEQAVWADVTPAVVFLLERESAFRAEQNQETFEILTSLYEELAKREGGRYPVVRLFNNDLELSAHVVQERILLVL